jgi:hypothetical protein
MESKFYQGLIQNVTLICQTWPFRPPFILTNSLGNGVNKNTSFRVLEGQEKSCSFEGVKFNDDMRSDPKNLLAQAAIFGSINLL